MTRDDILTWSMVSIIGTFFLLVIYSVYRECGCVKTFIGLMGVSALTWLGLIVMGRWPPQ